MSARIHLISALVAASSLQAAKVDAQWVMNGAPLCTATNYQQVVECAADGSGGATLVWFDRRDGGDDHLYALRVDASGNAAAGWPANGVAVCTEVACLVNVYPPVIVSDGAGGAIIAWSDARSFGSCQFSYFDIYAQRVSAAGVPLWTANGVLVCGMNGDQDQVRMIPDGAGGAIIAWRDQRAGDDVYAQRIGSGGAPLWTANGVVVSAAAQEQVRPTIVADGAGGAIVAWEDFRGNGSHSDVYAQRIDAAGSALWTAGGIALCTASINQSRVQADGDGAGGAIVIWRDQRTGAEGVYGQRVSASGSPLWGVNGAAFSTATSQVEQPAVVSDGMGGAVGVWRDGRVGFIDQIAIQRVDATGAQVWTPNGLLLTSTSAGKLHPRVVTDGTGGAIVTWEDYQPSLPSDIYAQRVTVAGAVQWTTGGVPICTATNYQWRPTIAADGAGGALIFWADQRTVDYDIYGQHVDPAGAVPGGSALLWAPNGEPVAAIEGIQQNPSIVSDQLGGAIVSWEDYRSGSLALYDIVHSPEGPGRAEIYTNRLTGLGDVAAGWPEDGAPVCTFISNQIGPVSARDAEGGSYIVWMDDRNGAFDLFAQRVTALGTLAAGWPATGVAVCTAVGAQINPRVVPDRVGGVFITWEDHRLAPLADGSERGPRGLAPEGPGRARVYCQHLEASALLASGWPVNGLELAPSTDDQLEPVITADGTGGAIIAWADRRSGDLDVFAQHVSAGGTLVAGWPAGGLALCAAVDDQVSAEIVPDGSGGAIVAWSDLRGVDSDIYAQRVTGAGTIAAGWPSDGVALCTATADQTRPAIGVSGTGGALVAWEDRRTSGTTGVDLFAQSITVAGVIASGWPVNGAALTLESGDQDAPTMVPDGAGGAIVAWEDTRSGAIDLFATQITKDAIIDPRWNTGGDPLCLAGGSQVLPAITSDGQGGAIVGWTDGRVIESDIYATHILGPASPQATTGVPLARTAAFRIVRPWPNPSRGHVTLALDLASASPVHLVITDVAGRLLRTLADEREMGPGRHAFIWDGRDDAGVPVRAGLYFQRARVADATAVATIALIR